MPKGISVHLNPLIKISLKLICDIQADLSASQITVQKFRAMYLRGLHCINLSQYCLSFEKPSPSFLVHTML